MLLVGAHAVEAAALVGRVQRDVVGGRVALRVLLAPGVLATVAVRLAVRSVVAFVISETRFDVVFVDEFWKKVDVKLPS